MAGGLAVSPRGQVPDAAWSGFREAFPHECDARAVPRQVGRGPVLLDDIAVAEVLDARAAAPTQISQWPRLSQPTQAAEAEPGDLPAGLARFEAARRPIVEKLVAASKRSAAWYDGFAEHMRLEPLELAMSYIMRSGRIDADRLRAMSPRFTAAYDARTGRG